MHFSVLVSGSVDKALSREASGCPAARESPLHRDTDSMIGLRYGRGVNSFSLVIQTIISSPGIDKLSDIGPFHVGFPHPHGRTADVV